MVETVVTAVLEVGKSLASPIGRQFMYLYNYRSNFEKMKKEVTKLKDARDEVKDKVDAAVKNVEKIKHSVKDWQENVNSTIDEAEKLIRKKETSYRCFNLMTSYKNGRKASKQVEALSELLKDKATFGEVSLPTIIEDRRLINNDYKAFESRNAILNDVLTALNDDERKTIGIYGMGGIGKTTLVKEIGNQAKKKQLFDEVVLVEVPQNPSTERIQEEVAQQLGLKFDTETEKASKLYARLNNKEKKILIILDNLWEAIDLKTIGIPDGDDNGRCKLLLTTRERDVLLNMGSRIFQIDNLSEEESWRLFKSTAWPDYDDDGI
ncbi:probable disease resistance protein At1g61310 [Pistacia vera]|uniref:probable disease resistance protein At1g61310 n=1 Tax=Pistacia vera TaxID=55513 RepID=UPI001263530B|nr:probable disease resistance protein At1g61310 [Pistacia vera]